MVEASIALEMKLAWIWCGAHDVGWDFERTDGLRLEVKQSATLPSWPGVNETAPCSAVPFRPMGHNAGEGTTAC